MSDDNETRWAWWTLDGRDLMGMLRRAHEGDDPGVVYLEGWANSDVDYRPGDDGGER